MHDWAKVLTGFALFLVFGALSRIKRDKERRWLGPLAVAMAVLALTGGLTLAYLKSTAQAAPKTVSAPAVQPISKTQTNVVEQTTTGAGSPAVQGVQGDVTISVDQSSGTWKEKSPPRKKAASK
jgi:disulfide bond formation protein DsbB